MTQQNTRRHCTAATWHTQVFAARIRGLRSNVLLRDFTKFNQACKRVRVRVRVGVCMCARTGVVGMWYLGLGVSAPSMRALRRSGVGKLSMNLLNTEGVGATDEEFVFRRLLVGVFIPGVDLTLDVDSRLRLRPNGHTMVHGHRRRVKGRKEAHSAAAAAAAAR